MVDVGAGILGLLSAGIFMAHALEAYRPQQRVIRGGLKPKEEGRTNRGDCNPK